METKHMTVGLFEAIDNESLELLKGGQANEISGLAQCALVLEHWIPWFRSPRGKA